MSDHDTDDTDVLLNSDPLGGLFRDLSLKELVDKHSSILPLTTRKASPSPNGPVIPETNGGEIMAATNHDLSGTSNMDLSDYFNSQGEIALSGLSEWSVDSEIEKEKADDDDDGGESDSSFTYNEENIRKTYDTETNNDNKKANRMDEVVPAKATTDETDTSASRSYVPQFLNHGRVVDINLENPAIDWNIPLPSHFQLQLGPGGSSYLNEKGEQIFTRAPNFRSANGYQSTTDKEPSRQLTKEQIAEEVKKMYADPEVPDLQIDTNPKINTRKVLRFADEIEHVAENPVESSLQGGFNFLNNNDTPVKFDSSPKNSFSVPEGEKLLGRKKQIASKGKRKSINKFQGAGDAASVSTTAASSSESSPSVKPPSSSASSTTSSSVPYCTKVIRGMKRTKPKQPPQPGFSFGYGDSENDLSPIRRIRDFNGPVAGSSASQPRVNNCTSHHHHHPSPLGRDDFHDGMGRVKGSAAAMDELKAIWREIQTNRILLRQGDESSEDDDGTSKASFIEDLGKGDGPPSAKSDAGKSSSSRGSHINHGVRPHHPSQPPFTAPFPSPSIDNFDSDLETLLNEADINPADFEDIVDDLDIAECDVGAGIDDLLREIVDPNASPQNKETAKLSHWAQSGAVEYVEKYHEEKFRRQECEDEIDRLQKENLNIRQRNAVLEGVTKRKDATIIKISKAWKEVATEWRAYESQTRGDFDKLKKDHVELSGICAQNNEKVQQYEKELIKSVELADNFKTQLTEVQKSKDVAVGKLEAELASLREKIKIMSKGEMEIMEEKKTAVRALTESQQKLDQLQVSYQKLETELHTQKTTAFQRDQKLSEISNQNSKLESLLDEKVTQNNELLKKTKQLSDTVEFAALEKERLHREHENVLGQKLKDEGERLHGYYNKKLQSALKAAGEKALQAEAATRESMKIAEVENERKLTECKDRCQSDLMRMKTIYEVEMRELKKDNAQKQLLITTTAQQLQTGGIARSNTMDRLQSIVKNFPSIHHPDTSFSIGGGQGDRPTHNNITTDLHLLMNKNKDINSNSSVLNSSKEYAKFAQTLQQSTNPSKNTTLKPENIPPSYKEVIASPRKFRPVAMEDNLSLSTLINNMSQNKEKSSPPSS